MIKQTIFCDICKQEVIRPEEWYNIPHPFSITVTTDCQNPLGYLEERPGFQYVKLDFNNICRDCAKGVAKVVAGFIQGKRNK